jgi:hypothetical protein
MPVVPPLALSAASNALLILMALLGLGAETAEH